MNHNENYCRNLHITLDNILSKSEGVVKTRIFCTIGPSCCHYETLIKFIQLGMNVARLNLSNGKLDTYADVIKNIRKAAKECGTHVAIMIDTKGPVICTGLLKGHKHIYLNKCKEVEIVNDYSFKGDKNSFACNYKDFPSVVSIGTKIFFHDTSLIMEVIKIKSKSVIVKVLKSGILKENTNMHLPGIKMNLPTITEKDKYDIVNFAVPNQVDLIAISYTKKAFDVHYTRKILDSYRNSIKIISKIGNRDGVENFEEIAEVSDVILIARGNLGLEIPPEKVFLAQKLMIKKCNMLGKMVITATQMLESMIENPRPTRAECTDVTNAVLDGTDAVLLCGETAHGKFPILALETMVSICREAETAVNYEKLYNIMRHTINFAHDGPLAISEAIASSGVKSSIDIDAKLIVVLTEKGLTPRFVAKYRPKVPLLVLTNDEKVARQCNGFVRGCTALIFSIMNDSNNYLDRIIEIGQKIWFLKPGDKIIVIHDLKFNESDSTNNLKVLEIPNTLSIEFNA